MEDKSLNTLIEEFKQKMRNEADIVEQKAKKEGIDFVYNNAYKIAKYNELEWTLTEGFIDHIEDRDAYYELGCDKLIKIDNLFDKIIEYHSNLRQEWYDFFDGSRIYEVIEFYLKECDEDGRFY